MKRTAKWMNHLSIKELKHMRESGAPSLRRFAELRDKQAKLKAEGERRIGTEFPGITEPCWDCRRIESKLRDAGVMK